MKIEYAKTIPLREILFKIGLKPLRTSSNELIYISPFQQEKRPTFKVFPDTNTWLDTHLDRQGNTVDFVCAYLHAKTESHTQADALRWLKNIMCAPAKINLPFNLETIDTSKYQVRNILPLSHIALMRYLDARKIDRRYVTTYLRELRILNPVSGKIFRAIGVRNEEGGFAIFNPSIKAHVGMNSVTFIRGTIPKSGGVHVFEDIFDYMSLLSARKGHSLEGDAIILNGYQCVNDAVCYLTNYGYAVCYLWLANTEKGFQVARALASALSVEQNLVTRRMNNLYSPHETVNVWWINRIKPIG